MNNLNKFFRHLRTYGPSSAASSAIRYLRAQCSSSLWPILRRREENIIGTYEAYLGHAHGNENRTPSTPDSSIQWVIPDFGIGSGGHLNIFRFINLLSERGFKQRIVIIPPYKWRNEKEARISLEKWYFPLRAEITLGIDGFRPSYFTFATGWQTAYWVAKHRESAEKFYFVQDFEPSFYPVSSEYFLAENTYRLGLKGITAGSWLSEKLFREYGMPCAAISFGCDSDIYTPRPRQKTSEFKILFYSRHSTRRRLFELGLLALNEVCRRNPHAKVIFAGGDVSGFRIQFPHENLGNMRLSDLPAIYSQCELALVLSGTNLSLLPLELAACGCPVVMNDSPSTRWLMPDDAAYYAPLDPESIAEVICRAVADDKGRHEKAARAYALAQAASWEAEATRIVELLDNFPG